MFFLMFSLSWEKKKSGGNKNSDETASFFFVSIQRKKKEQPTSSLIRGFSHNLYSHHIPFLFLKKKRSTLPTRKTALRVFRRKERFFFASSEEGGVCS